MNNEKLLFLGTGGVSDAVRLHLPSIELSKMGYSIQSVSISEFQQTGKIAMLNRILEDSYTHVLVSRPASSRLMEFLKEKNQTVIVDMDDDFHAIPIHHPGYKSVGLGNPHFIGEIEECVAMADGLIVTTEALKERWTPLQKNIKIIQNGWSRTDPFWGYKYNHPTFNVGWGGTITHRVDFEIISRTLSRIAQKYSNIRIVIAGDPQIYMSLRNIPERQKMFLPMVQYKDYPHSLAYFDLMLAPVEDNEFNRAKSDIKLVDACAMGMPFVASGVGEYAKWREGGVIVTEPEEWYNAIEIFYKEPITYKDFSIRGNQYVQAREMGVLVHKWVEVLS